MHSSIQSKVLRILLFSLRLAKQMVTVVACFVMFKAEKPALPKTKTALCKDLFILVPVAPVNTTC